MKPAVHRWGRVLAGLIAAAIVLVGTVVIGGLAVVLSPLLRLWIRLQDKRRGKVDGPIFRPALENEPPSHVARLSHPYGGAGQGRAES